MTLPDALSLIKEAGALGLLAWLLWRGIPALVSALDRNTRILFHIEGKLDLKPTDFHERKKDGEGN